MGALLLIFVLGWKFQITCPILMLLGVPCPCCGATRAMLSLLRGDLVAYAKFNVMALPLCFSVVIAVAQARVRHRRFALVLLIVMLAVNLLYYFWRLWLYSRQGIFPPV